MGSSPLLFARILVWNVPGTVPEDSKGSETCLKSPPQEAHLGQTLVHSVEEIRLIMLANGLSMVPRLVPKVLSLASPVWSIASFWEKKGRGKNLVQVVCSIQKVFD